MQLPKITNRAAYIDMDHTDTYNIHRHTAPARLSVWPLLRERAHMTLLLSAARHTSAYQRLPPFLSGHHQPP